MAQAAADVADVMSIYRQVFPDVQYGDIENLPLQDDPQWWADFAAWADALKTSTGRALAFFHMDVAWSSASWSYSIS
jgi:hypothetical protein